MSYFIKFAKQIDDKIDAALVMAMHADKNKFLDKKTIKKILIIKYWALGDSIVLLPLIKALKKGFPDAEIDVMPTDRNKTIFEGQKDIHKIIECWGLGFWFGKYDLCIDAEPFLNLSALRAFFSGKYTVGFSHGVRSRLYNLTVDFNKKQHMVQNYLDFARKLGVEYNTDELAPLVISSDDKKIISKYLKNNKISKSDFIVGISSGVAESVKYRMWPVENFAQLADELIKKYSARIIFIDSKNNKNMIDKIVKNMKERAINASGLFTVKQSAELIKNCSMFISNDSGMMHVAAAEGVKTIGLFGPNTPILWGPYGKHNISIKAKIAPFMDNTKPELVPKHLTKKQKTCMDTIEVNEVLNAVKRLK